MSLKKTNFLLFIYCRAFKISCFTELSIKKVYNLGARFLKGYVREANMQTQEVFLLFGKWREKYGCPVLNQIA